MVTTPRSGSVCVGVGGGGCDCGRKVEADSADGLGPAELQRTLARVPALVGWAVGEGLGSGRLGGADWRRKKEVVGRGRKIWVVGFRSNDSKWWLMQKK